jgi:hypothetical protein
VFDRERRRAERTADLRLLAAEAAGPCWVVVRDDDGPPLELANDVFTQALLDLTSQAFLQTSFVSDTHLATLPLPDRRPQQMSPRSTCASAAFAFRKILFSPFSDLSISESVTGSSAESTCL